MNNKKAQMAYVGLILMAFVGIVVGVALFQGASTQVGEATSTSTIVNTTFTPGAVGTQNTFTDYKSFTDVIVVNATGTIVATNYSVANNQVVNGALAVVVTTLDKTYNSTDWKISATAERTGYISDSGGRAIASLILVFMALAIAIIALEPTLRSGVLNALGK